MAAHGAYLTSLAEARSTSDCFLVVNPQELLQHFPQLPAILNKHLVSGESSNDSEPSIAPKSEACVILIGSADESLRNQWSQHFSNVLVGAGDCESLPQFLMGLTKREKDADEGLAANPLAEWKTQGGWEQQLTSARYPVVVWGSIALPVPAIDMWAGRMQTWLLQWNKHSRGSGLVLSPLASVFQHTCAWLTGFPSRINFAEGEMRWDREEASTARWLERNRADGNALLIWIDESSQGKPPTARRFTPSDRLRVIELVAHDHDWESAELVHAGERRTRQRIPIGRPGVDYPATLLRADQVVMAYPQGDASLQCKERIRCDRWLRTMLPEESLP